jgi:uncharacterized protein
MVLLLGACAGGTRGTTVADGERTADTDVRTGAAATFALEHGLDDLPRTTVRIERAAGPEGDAAGTGAERAAPLHFAVLVAETPAARRRGLQGVASLPDGVGMLFVFPGPPDPDGRPGFWMLGTLLALDIAFLQDGRVVGVATMTPCEARPCPITHPGVEFDMALEVAGGDLVAAGVAPGDLLVLGPDRGP